MEVDDQVVGTRVLHGVLAWLWRGYSKSLEVNWIMWLGEVEERLRRALRRVVPAS